MLTQRALVALNLSKGAETRSTNVDTRSNDADTSSINADIKSTSAGPQGTLKLIQRALSNAGRFRCKKVVCLLFWCLLMMVELTHWLIWSSWICVAHGQKNRPTKTFNSEIRKHALDYICQKCVWHNSENEYLLILVSLTMVLFYLTFDNIIWKE